MWHNDMGAVAAGLSLMVRSLMVRSLMVAA